MYFPALTGLRAVFVAMVIGAHAGLPLHAALGVTGFFVLSGFLITSLLLEEIRQSGDVSLKGFYWRRTLRIFPAYYVFLFVSIGADLALGNDEIKPAILPGLTYLVNYYNAFNDHPNVSIAHAWSLAVEEQFYLLWPLALLAIVRWKRAALPWILGAAIIAVMLWRTVAYGWLGTSYVYNAFDTRFDSLAIGCLLAVLLPHLKSAEAAISKTWLVPPVIISMVMLNASDWRYTFGFTACSILLAILMVQMMNLHRERLWSWLEWRSVKYVGAISYGLYLYHIFGLNAGHKLLGDYGDVLGIVVTFGVAMCSYHFLERPLLKLKPRQPDGAAVAPA